MGVEGAPLERNCSWEGGTRKWGAFVDMAYVLGGVFGERRVA